MSCEKMFERHQSAWLSAFNHAFLRDCKHGTISKKQFDAWLAQDYMFVREFTRLAATLLTRAPYADFDVLLGGLVALRDELSWFQVCLDGIHDLLTICILDLNQRRIKLRNEASTLMPGHKKLMPISASSCATQHFSRMQCRLWSSGALSKHITRYKGDHK